ncbi:hypothetical protein SASPL_142736 [Salvia splendens]|uniref:AT-rich interactive domain-containing protein 2 n=1 Tax=Salvia splendens TaxID=180675 RepID=A0A8X8ZA39_SALSN|nr:uncharacterized protein LOC121772477 [Salvia splendens]XP_042025534.1 uncharacterized protein LOC121772477 [Salvia splendens]KAG6396584.1 hypothetical protein SASPL_142736 [Salvia splendens]
MGMKRPLEEGDFPDTSFRQPKQREYHGKLTLNAEEYHITTLAVQSPDEPQNSFYRLHFEQLEDGEADNASVPDKEGETSAPLSLVTSSSSEDDSVIGETSHWSCFPEYIDINIPRRPMNQIEEPYTDLFNSPPRKEVPLGSDHQAEVPLWDPNASYCCDDFREERITGTCIIAMPNLNNSTMEGVGVGRGRTDCCCLDMGSMRCVQQHVNEAREKLRVTIGYENFVDLGFCNMGHEVAYQWTPHDEEVFHDIVYSNPESHGRKFWKHLSVAFPTRTKNELVSYYFNVFVLRRRAVQNRSYLLEIDSDDDEELRGVHGGSRQDRFYSSDQETDIEDHQGREGEFYLVEGEEEDSTVYSFGDQDLDTSWVDDFWSEPQNGSGEHEVSNLKDDVSDGHVEKLDAVEMKSREDGETLPNDPRLYT